MLFKEKAINIYDKNVLVIAFVIFFVYLVFLFNFLYLKGIYIFINKRLLFKSFSFETSQPQSKFGILTFLYALRTICFMLFFLWGGEKTDFWIFSEGTEKGGTIFKEG